MNSLPIWAIFVASAFGIFLAIEVGYKLGCIVHRRAEDEKESPVSAISGSILGLLAFLLAFTFGIAADLYAARADAYAKVASIRLPGGHFRTDIALAAAEGRITL